MAEEEKEAVPVKAAPQVAAETTEQKQWRLRAEASHKEREEIFRRNGLLNEGQSLPLDQADVNARCCGK